MPSFLVPLGSVLRVFLVLLYFMGIQSIPINSRFSVKFNPLLGKEEIKTQSLGAIFAKIPQEFKSLDSQRLLSKAILTQDANLGMGSTNQIAKIILPTQPQTDDSKARESKKIINIPIITQPFNDYNIIVATAPKNIRIGKGEEAKPVVVYIVFPGDDSDPNAVNIPSIYFITKPTEPLPFQKKKEDPILVVDSNRTVTGLKSKAMTKFVKFKNKMTNRVENNQFQTN